MRPAPTQRLLALCFERGLRPQTDEILVKATNHNRWATAIDEVGGRAAVATLKSGICL